jgi:hypothetical protein
VCATRDIEEGEVVFRDESSSFTLVTKSHVQKNWNASEKLAFAQYAWPLSKEVWHVDGGDFPNSFTFQGIRDVEPGFSFVETDKSLVFTKVGISSFAYGWSCVDPSTPVSGSARTTL